MDDDDDDFRVTFNPPLSFEEEDPDIDWVEGDLSLDEKLEEDFPPPEDGTISTLGAEEVLLLLLLPLPRLLLVTKL